MRIPTWLRWRLKQRIAAPASYYGDGGTVYSTGHIDVEMYHGEVVGVWFRCKFLPFRVHQVELRRALTLDEARFFEHERITGIETIND